MNCSRLILILVFGLFCFKQISAQESSVYLMGSGGSFSPLLPSEGFAGKSITGMYWASKFADRNGDAESVPDRINGFYQKFMALYVTKFHILKAKYVVGAMIPFSTAETNPSGVPQIRTRLFMADPYISPVGLSWQKPYYQIFAEYRLYLPLGQYDADNNFNIGKGQYSHMISLSGTYFLNHFKTWSVTLLPRYEFHGERKDSNITGGSYFNIEWAITNSSHEIMDFGFVGYASAQLSKDVGAGVPPDIKDIKDRIVAIGGEWGILARKIKTRFALRANFELYGVDRPIGTLVTLDIYYVPSGILFEN